MNKKSINADDNLDQIPPKHDHKFINGIRHPLLYLWDAWSYIEADSIHLYCLALSRLKSNGEPIEPFERNNFPFHIRHFSSDDNGTSWKDEGCFLKIGDLPKASNFYTIWSGSVEPLPDGRKLVAFTGLEKANPEHNFLQNIVLAVSENGYTVDHIAAKILSSPIRDWEEITQKGYFLDVPKKLGSNAGEGGGPILSWRDPFIFLDSNNKVHLLWGGKVSPTKGAIVRAELIKEGSLFTIKELHPPATVPDGNEFTQLELPKVYFDSEKNQYYLMVSSCNRLFEGQSDDEVDKCVRLYKSDSIDGPWKAIGNKILGPENLFGPTVLKTDFKNNRLLCIAPYTDAAEAHLSLSFSPVFYIYLDSLRVEFLC